MNDDFTRSTSKKRIRDNKDDEFDDGGIDWDSIFYDSQNSKNSNKTNTTITTNKPTIMNDSNNLNLKEYLPPKSNQNSLSTYNRNSSNSVVAMSSRAQKLGNRVSRVLYGTSTNTDTCGSKIVVDLSQSPEKKINPIVHDKIVVDLSQSPQKARKKKKSADNNNSIRQHPSSDIHNYNRSTITAIDLTKPIVAGRDRNGHPVDAPSNLETDGSKAKVTTTTTKIIGQSASPSSTNNSNDDNRVIKIQLSHHQIVESTNSTTTTTTTTASLSSLATTTIMPSQEILPQLLKYDPERLRPVMDEHRTKLIQNAGIAKPLENGWMLMKHQKQAVLKGIQYRRLIVAFDMGLGKTLIACAWARTFKRTFPNNLKVFVVAPVSLHKEWKRTAVKTTGLYFSEDTDDPLDMEIASWSKIPVPPSKTSVVRHFVVICDEAHSMQSMTAARTKSTLKLLLDKRCIGCLLLSGTPMKNGKPSNLFPLLKAVKHPFADDQKTFETFFCNGQMRQYGNGRGNIWTADGCANLQVLREHTSSHILHKTKEEVLKDLPPKTREYKEVPVSSKNQIRHMKALDELRKKHENSKRDPDAQEETILGAFMNLRQVASFAKVEATVALAGEILQKQSSIVIFTQFVNVAKLIRDRLEENDWSTELLTGETPPAKRQEKVDRFQEGLSAAFVCSFGAGAVGLTLTAACTVILNDRPWTPGDAVQAEDRVRRIGQTRPVTSIWMQAFEVDKQIDELILSKQSKANAVIDKNAMDDSGKSSSRAKINIYQLLAGLLPTTNSPLGHNNQQQPIPAKSKECRSIQLSAD